MNGITSFTKDTQPSQHNGQHGMYPTDLPHTSATPFPEFSMNSLNSNSQMRFPHSQDSSQSPYNLMNAYWAASQQSQQHPAPMLSHPQLNNQWNNSSPAQSQFMNGTNAVMNGMSNMPMNMPAFNMSLFQQQILHDALALSTPVAGADDERLLIDTLVNARARKDNYKNALNSLHGKNGHSVILWKDFYLEWKDKIDMHVSVSLKNKGIPDPLPMIKVAKKPTPASFQPEPSPPSSPEQVTKSSGRHSKTSISRSFLSSSSSSGTKLPSAKNGHRSTINSITAHAPSYNSRLPAPNAEVKIPHPPSRSPSPPTKVVAHGRGNKFTEEDREFFIRFIQWRLRCDPNLTRNDLCDQLAEKVPHHTSQSWAAHWSNNHDLPDKILAAAYEEAEGYDEDTEDESSEEVVQPSRTRNPRYYKESSVEEDGQDDQDADIGDEDDDFVLPSFDESAMGKGGDPFTDADFALTARYIASFDDFAKTSTRQRWKPWSQRYPQRSDKSWAEYYRRQERDLLVLAGKIKKAGAAKGLSPKREVSDSAALASPAPHAIVLLKTKRKYAPEDQEQSDDGNRSKMSKIE
ncbi:hypothetical protein DFH05DRAFT_1436748 [Lentinula detonsa]|uniref:Uncharacterized protein n=1 Tax=Lentinula detonsa TaxID=2804962 RepID=A0A9W8U2Z0_9AGAR|nr:hypothetical protein DFH05DRAFT_1436748 [Lentinula detonsa]